MGSKRTRLELKLIRYRDQEANEYLYFWTERQGEVDVHVGPMFENKDDALFWYKELEEKVEACMSKLDRM